MHLKRFRRETVKEALRAVREEMGASALVLSTRVVTAPGVRGWFGARMVEITAAAERPGLSDDRQVPAPRQAERAADALTARLLAAGIDAALARDVVAALPARRRRGASVDLIRRTLSEQLTPLAAADDDFARFEVFVGPPGVGKTTTIAKLAAQERAVRGTRLGLLSADGFRVGAVEQLRLYADILGSPLKVARTPAELETALDHASRPMLLDTAGRSPSDEVSREMLRVLAGRKGVRTHLVLAAGTSPSDARRAFDRFEDARPARVVITKLDEAESLGPMVSVLRERQVPVSFLGTGQRVPEDLERATPAMLAAWTAGDSAWGAVA